MPPLWVRGFSVVTDRVGRINRPSAECMLERLDDLLAAHAHDDSIHLGFACLNRSPPDPVDRATRFKNNCLRASPVI